MGVQVNCREVAFLDMKTNMKIFKFPVAKYYLVAAFLCNCHATFYGNQISLYFNADVMSSDTYLNL